MTEPCWRYVGETAAGKAMRGVVHAPSQKSALRNLKAKGLTPTLIEPAATPGKGAISLQRAPSPLSLRNIADICRSIYDLLNAGVPIGKTMDLLAAQHQHKKLRTFFSHVAASVRSGAPLSTAVATAPAPPPQLACALIAAGERTGKLDEQFSILAAHYDAQFRMRRELTAQLIYPCALLVLIVLTLFFLSHFVLPQFETIFLNAETLPPPETQIVMAAGEALRTMGAYIPASFLAALLIGKFVAQQFGRQIEQIILVLPIISGIRRKITAGRFCRSLGAMLIGGASLSDALPIALRTISSKHLVERYDAAAKAIKAGGGVALAIEQQRVAPSSVIALIRLGEESGALGPMLAKAADRCEQDIKSTLTKLVSIIGPVMTAIMGLMTAGVIAAVMSGVLSLNETVY